MPTIPNFPASLLEEHKMWHHAHHVDDLNQLRPGYGQQFLQFHRAFIRKALDWYARQPGYDQALVAPWQGVPEQIRRAPCYDRASEARIVTQPQTFATADELGLFIEGSGLHGCIHETAADVYGEPDINDFDVAPRNTIFYNIHSMIDGWYRNWEAAGRFNQGWLEWGGRFVGDSDSEGDASRGEESGQLAARQASEAPQALRYVPESGRWWLGARHPAPGGSSGREPRLDWRPLAEVGGLGTRPDIRLLRVWDTDGDGRSEVLYYSEPNAKWWEGRLDAGTLTWQPIRRA